MSERLSVNLRPATPADARRVWAWRNDPASRAASLNLAQIPYPAHEAWFSAALADPARTLLIGATAEGEAVGMVRFDRMAAVETRVSIAIDPAWRGRGVGRVLLAQAVARRLGEPLRAEVRDGNAASLRLFEGCGFQRLSQQDGVVLFGRG